MPENAPLDGCLGDVDVDIVERKETLQLFIVFDIQPYFGEVYFSNIASIFDIFGVERTRSTVHTADRQPEADRSPDHVVDEIVITSVTNARGCI